MTKDDILRMAREYAESDLCLYSDSDARGYTRGFISGVEAARPATYRWEIDDLLAAAREALEEL